MKTKIFFIILIVSFLLIVLQSSTLACTIFNADNGIMILGGNNGDYSDPDTYIVFYPADNGKHGRMYAGWKQFWWQTGMNDQGLFFASASTSFLEVLNSTQKPRPSKYLMYKCLEECSTVEDVLEVFDQYNLDFLETMQLLVSDATGASVIIEGDPIHIKQDYYQVVTNFRLSQINPLYPCWRFNIALTMFENTTMISPEFFTTICNATHQEGEYPTQFSTVYNLQQKIIYLYWQHDYDQVKIFNLTEELQSGYHIYSIPALFSTSTPPTPPTITGQLSGTPDTEYQYTFVSTDQEEDEISYYIDWGDNTYTDWTRTLPSGQYYNSSHSWSERGSYTIKAKAKDTYGAESDWASLKITMPKTYIYNPIMQLFMRMLDHLPFFEKIIKQVL